MTTEILEKGIAIKLKLWQIEKAREILGKSPDTWQVAEMLSNCKEYSSGIYDTAFAGISKSLVDEIFATLDSREAQFKKELEEL